MAAGRARINGRDVVDSGFLIGRKDWAIELHPIPGDAFPVIVELHVLEDDEYTKKDAEFEVIPQIEPPAVIVKIYRKWDRGSPEVETNIVVASGQDSEYILSITFDLFGDRSKYMFNFGYCVHIEPADGK